MSVFLSFLSIIFLVPLCEIMLAVTRQQAWSFPHMPPSVTRVCVRGWPLHFRSACRWWNHSGFSLWLRSILAFLAYALSCKMAQYFSRIYLIDFDMFTVAYITAKWFYRITKPQCSQGKWLQPSNRFVALWCCFKRIKSLVLPLCFWIAHLVANE